MNKDEIKQKLEEIGIISTNVYPKSTFIKNGEIYLGMFKKELEEDFYFFNSYNKKIYQFKKPESLDNYETEVFNNSTKWLIPLYECNVVWEDKVYVELPDDQFSSMTLRDYACIHLGLPESSKEWLNVLIKNGSNGKDK